MLKKTLAGHQQLLKISKAFNPLGSVFKDSVRTAL
jgi:hypothetical protein